MRFNSTWLTLTEGTVWLIALVGLPSKWIPHGTVLAGRLVEHENRRGSCLQLDSGRSPGQVFRDLRFIATRAERRGSGESQSKIGGGALHTWHSQRARKSRHRAASHRPVPGMFCFFLRADADCLLVSLAHDTLVDGGRVRSGSGSSEVCCWRREQNAGE